jgi:hypothetical protein
MPDLSRRTVEAAAEIRRRREQDDIAKHAEQESMDKAYSRSQDRIRKDRAAKEGLRVVLEDEPGRQDVDVLRSALEKLEKMANSEEGAWN